MDEVWVATEHIYRAVATSSPVPVTKVPLPVTLPPIVPYSQVDLGMPEGFTFLFVYDYYSTSARKNPLGVIEAFKRAFPEGSGASLVLKSINHKNPPEHHKGVAVSAAHYADIHLISRYVSADEKNAMLASCDCYVSLHRSEGFCLTPAETMFLGKPVIATAYGGVVDFMMPATATRSAVAILETVNPHCLPAAKGFWIDPTHQHPLFPEVVLALCRIVGFADRYVFYPIGRGDFDVDHLREPAFAAVVRKADSTAVEGS